MKIDKIVKTAQKLPAVSLDSTDEIRQKTEMLCAEMNEKMLARPDIIELIGGDKNIEIMKDNHANHMRFILSIIVVPDSTTLVDTIVWVFRAYKSRGFVSAYWSAQINTWLSVFKEHLSERTYSEICPLYWWISNNIPLLQEVASESILE